MDLKKLVIAVDGFSSCGKSTFAKAIAKKLQYIYIDSGAMYRAATLFCLNNNLFQGEELQKEKLVAALPGIKISFNRVNGANETWLNGENVEAEIRGIRVSNHVSAVSQVKEVRQKLVALQQEMGKAGGIVMDGRDIGTAVFPDADIKLFMTASPDVRAQRRYLELKEKGSEVPFDEIKANIEKRDHLDQTREESPLRMADDAILLDNSNMTPDEQMAWFTNLLRKFESERK